MSIKVEPAANPEPAVRQRRSGQARARAKIACLIGLLSLAACKQLPDKPAVSKFYPVGDNGFHYEAWATAAHPDYSPKAEAARMRQLGVYLSDDHLCPKGYEITGRRIVGVNGNFALVSYDGVCT